jgi:Domain of unknown function (DUF4345)
MQMNKIARGYLYLNVLLFAAIGVKSLFMPESMAGQLQLAATSIAGTGEIRGLYGGGFIGFALVLLGGLRCKPLSPGLLIAMATVMGGVVCGRIVSLALDHEYMLTLVGGTAEALVALACWSVYKHDTTTSNVTR